MDAKKLARVFSALSSDIRLTILDIVSAHKEMCICELVDQLEMSQANISRHVSILRDAGVLHDRKLGTWVLVRVDEAAIEAALTELAGTVVANHRRSAREDPEARLAARCAA
ncbi:MAG: metalloregulator ArsR/SmtB family transcription factor [Armatimonadota bacterium]|jgi:ArsR family transcriptional regulator